MKIYLCLEFQEDTKELKKPAKNSINQNIILTMFTPEDHISVTLVFITIDTIIWFTCDIPPNTALSTYNKSKLQDWTTPSDQAAQQ